MRRIGLPLLFLNFFSFTSFAQQVEWDASRILLEIEKLNTTGSVLYIAAHPDDENTRLIAYMANERKVRTGYLSLTRGDGGQNLIGDEQSAYLGVIRTQELLEARKVDGGEQYFTRAVDFGYSKSAAETFTKWDHDSVLADVVWVIRNFRPDIIITRFPADERAGHGQHTVSAMLAEEAFEAAADPSKFPEQLAYVQVWQTKRLFWNNSVWWDKDLPEKIKNGDKDLVVFNDGGYNSLLGRSYGEIAADSRTHHKSQGFGATPGRDERAEYIELKKGTALTSSDPFEGIYINWDRYRQGSEIAVNIDMIISGFDPRDPAASVDQLLKVYALLSKMPTDKLIEYKKQQLQNIIIASLGLWLEPAAEKYMVAAGEKLKIISTVTNRSEYKVTLRSFSCLTTNVQKDTLAGFLKNVNDTVELYIPDNAVSSPYWLNGEYSGLFHVHDQKLIGKPQNDPALSFVYKVDIGGTEFNITRPVIYKETDAVKGEIYKPLIVTDRMAVSFTDANYIFSGDQHKKITVGVKNNNVTGRGQLSLTLPVGWSIEPAEYKFDLQDVLKQKEFTFDVMAGKNAVDGIIQAAVNVPLYESSVSYHSGFDLISYDHIPEQMITKNAQAKIISLDAVIPSGNIGYIEGAGDKVVESLTALGLNIHTLDIAAVTPEELNKYDVVIIGVRAYNTSHALVDAYDKLMEYIKGGGLVIAQYSNMDLLTDTFGPYPFKISQGRVTDENSPYSFLDAASPLLNYPNKITAADFNGWVQERGLYFAADAAAEYKNVLSFTDPGEKPLDGSIIICDYGNGAFIYTGISFFRELPAGVPGAYRLFANMLAYKDQSK